MLATLIGFVGVVSSFIMLAIVEGHCTSISIPSVAHIPQTRCRRPSHHLRRPHKRTVLVRQARSRPALVGYRHKSGCDPDRGLRVCHNTHRLAARDICLGLCARLGVCDHRSDKGLPLPSHRPQRPAVCPVRGMSLHRAGGGATLFAADIRSSTSATRRVIFRIASGSTDIESIPCSTRKSANSG